MQTSPVAKVNLTALKRNYQQLKQHSGNQKLVAVIKGDAYGHNALEVAKALPSADQFAVARIEEALLLRQGGITQPILLLEGCFCQQDLILAAQHDLDVVIHNYSQLDDLQSTKLPAKLRLWIKVDTGMHRLGFHPDEVTQVITKMENLHQHKGELGFVSHFSCADNTSSDKTLTQIADFEAATAKFIGPKSIANSAGILLWPQFQYDVARAGIALYGISPTDKALGSAFGLTPVMTLTTTLIAIREHEKGATVGYGDTWQSKTDTKLGVIALGYGDGYPRSAPEGTPVYINGRYVPIVGRVSMDMIVVDLGLDSQDHCGDRVELWGSNLPIEDVARHLDTIPYELTIKLTSRVKRQYCYEHVVEAEMEQTL